jgi:hypothetical protein
VTVFETETMAELCIKQGLMGEALAIYRRLVEDAPDDATRARRAARLAALEAQTVAPTLTMPAASSAPSLSVEQRGAALTFSWALPATTSGPALQLLLVRRGEAGIETETRTLRLDSPHGTMTLDARGLVSVRAAVGRVDGEKFVPMARLPEGSLQSL